MDNERICCRRKNGETDASTDIRGYACQTIFPKIFLGNIGDAVRGFTIVAEYHTFSQENFQPALLHIHRMKSFSVAYYQGQRLSKAGRPSRRHTIGASELNRKARGRVRRATM